MLARDIEVLSMGGNFLTFGRHIAIPESFVGYLPRTTQKTPDTSKIVPHQPGVECVGSPNAIHRRRPLKPSNGYVVPANDRCASGATEANEGARVFRLEKLKMLVVNGISGPAIRDTVENREVAHAGVGEKSADGEIDLACQL